MLLPDNVKVVPAPTVKPAPSVTIIEPRLVFELARVSLLNPAEINNPVNSLLIVPFRIKSVSPTFARFPALEIPLVKETELIVEVSVDSTNKPP